MQLLAASPQTAPELILTILINDLEAAGIEIGLVLDDYHCIKNPVVHTAVSFLLDHCPTLFHLLIASRSDPPVPLPRLRARSQLLDLRVADLSFTQAEASKFLNEIMGLQLDDNAIATLAERTEGWIAGLQMAALSMRNREDVRGFIQGFSGTNRHILDYLLEEVLSRESEEMQSFLLQTAVLNRLSGPLCDAVTTRKNSQQILETLEKNNLFLIPLDDNRQWYRYHHLFADLLQARLHQLEPDKVPQLLLRAARWCEGNGQIHDAINYAFVAQDYDYAGQLIAQHAGQAISQGEIETVWSWLSSLPTEVLRQSAPLSIAYCWLLWLRGEIHSIASHLIFAERALDACLPADQDQDEYKVLSAQLAGLKSFAARYQNEFETAVNLANQALTLLPESLPSAINIQLHTMLFLALASAYEGAGQLEKGVTAYTETIRWSREGANATGVAGITYRLAGDLWLLGRLQHAETACREAFNFIQAQGMARLPAVGILHLALSEVLVEQNKLPEAEQHLTRGNALGKWSGRLDAAKNALFSQARLLLAQNDLAGAITAVLEAEAALPQPSSPLARAEILALKTKLLLKQGALNKAATSAAEAVKLAGSDQGQSGQMATLAAYHVRLVQEPAETAIVELTNGLTVAERNGRFGVALELYILRSLAQARQGNRREAMQDLQCALKLAAPEGYTRIFIDEGQPMQALLAKYQSKGEMLQKYATYLLSQFGTMPHQASQIAKLIDPLSQRELEVLHIMALGKTNQQIAQQLVVARGTIKAHTASIYRKLNVSNRTEAVARARQIGLLP